MGLLRYKYSQRATDWACARVAQIPAGDLLMVEQDMAQESKKHNLDDYEQAEQKLMESFDEIRQE